MQAVSVGQVQELRLTPGIAVRVKPHVRNMNQNEKYFIQGRLVKRNEHEHTSA